MIKENKTTVRKLMFFCTAANNLLDRQEILAYVDPAFFEVLPNP